MPRFSQRHGGIKKKSYRLQRWFSGQECLMLLQRIQVPSIHTGGFQLSTSNSSPGDLIPSSACCRHLHPDMQAHTCTCKPKQTQVFSNKFHENVCFGKERWRRGQGTSDTDCKAASYSEKNPLLPLHLCWALRFLGHSPAPH